MKKLLLVLLIFIAPSAVFAQLYIGPTALYNFEFVEAESAAAAGLNASDFTFGADARLKLGLLRGAAMALYTPGYDDGEFYEPAFLELYPTAGVGFDLLFLTTYVGIGPGLGFIFWDDGVEQDAFNVGAVLVASGGLTLGRVDLLLNFLTDFDLSNFEANSNGYLGLSVLWSLW